MIEKAYKRAGYEVPQIVYWDLANEGTVEVSAEWKGVAMMNSFSPGMLKVFMGDLEEEEEAGGGGGRMTRRRRRGRMVSPRWIY